MINSKQCIFSKFWFKFQVWANFGIEKIASWTRSQKPSNQIYDCFIFKMSTLAITLSFRSCTNVTEIHQENLYCVPRP